MGESTRLQAGYIGANGSCLGSKCRLIGADARYWGLLEIKWVL